MVNEIVKYSNAFNAQPLRKFNAVHLDMLMAIASRLRDKGTNEVTFTFAELRDLIHVKQKTSNREFMNTLLDMNSRLLACNSMIVVDGVYIQFPLFNGFETNPEKQTLLVSLNQRFAFLVNDLTANFTRFELEQFTSVKSTYAKECYRRLKQYRQTGVWKVSVEDFRRLLDVPETYDMANLTHKVINPILKELKPLLHLELKKIYKREAGMRGRGKLHCLEWHFDKEFTPDQQQRAAARAERAQREADRAAESSGAKFDIAAYKAAHGGRTPRQQAIWEAEQGLTISE